MKKQIFKYFLLLVIFFAVPNFASAADFYMSTTGTKTSGTSTVGDWSNANCYNNLQAVFDIMQSNDTLTIDDGVYAGNNNGINQFNYPPSGSGMGNGDAKYTIIKARNIPCDDGLACDQPLKVEFDNASGAQFMVSNYPDNDPGKNVTYVKFHGLKFQGISAHVWDHIYYKQVASMGVTDGNSATFSVAGQYNLLEDCVAYGKGRYKFLFYDYSRELQSRGNGNNICRRCIARNDFALKETDSQNPIASFASYFNRGTDFLNVIDIDSDSPAFWKSDPGEISGAFYQPVDDGQHDMTVHGSVVVNSALGFSFTEGLGSSFVDVAGVHIAGGYYGKEGGAMNGVTMVDSGLDNFTYKNQTQINAVMTGYFGVFGYNGNVSISNSIFRDITPSTYDVFHGDTAGSYLDTYLLNRPIGDLPTNSSTSDPLANGLLYPVRIEDGSILKTAGSGGGQIGADIMNKLGKDGTMQGDTDWNTKQEPLWPWPMEDWVKAEMASMPAVINGDPMPSAARGFASATAKQLNGTSDVTLTSYIWESLGHQIPCEIYETCSGDDIAPNAPSGLGVM